MYNKGIYIFGASTNGELTFKICKESGIKVLGFLDNYSDKFCFQDYPVYRPENADRTKLVVVTSPIHSYAITLQLGSMGYKTINMSQFYFYLGMEPDWQGDYLKHQNEYEWIRGRLGDAKSIQVFDAIMKYRATFDLYYPYSTKTDIKDQWFDKDFFVPGPHVFVDGGAYNGDTGEEFIKRCPEYKSVNLYEPCRSLADEANNKLNIYKNVNIHYCGLSDERKQCYLHNAGLPSGKVGIDGEKIMLERLDYILDEQPTFIKLDVEGSEKAAIFGAERFINDGKPFMAVAVYHKPEDIWEIPQILSLMRDYKFYLRHYTEFYHETVLYAI